MITSCLLLLRTNDHFSKFKSRVLVFIVSSVFICVDLIGFIIIIAFRYLNASESLFLSLFFNDLFLLGLLTFQVLHFRQVEKKILVEIGIYKDLDLMKDKELFDEYDKLLMSAKKMRKIMRRAERKEKRKKRSLGGVPGMGERALGRSSVGSNSGVRLNTESDDGNNS